MPEPAPDQPPRPANILLAAPRGFCAGVDRAIKIVELALQKFGAPVYVRHEIVHNRHVVESLKAKGAIFVEELDEIPETDAPVIFSAHGVPRAVPAAAKARNMFYLDATCPLVSKVHAEAGSTTRQGLRDRADRPCRPPEVVGTMGQLPAGAAALIETVADARAFEPRDPERSPTSRRPRFRWTTRPRSLLSCRQRFPAIVGPRKEDICYATTNRQAAVKAIAARCDRADRGGRAQQLQLAAAGGGGRARRLPQGPAGAAGRARSPGSSSTASPRSASPPAPRRPRCWWSEIIDAFRARFDVRVERVVTARGAHRLQRAARAARGRRALTPIPRHAHTWRSIPKSPTRSWRSSSPATIWASCCPTRASPRASRTPTISCTPSKGPYILTLYEKRVRPGRPAVLPRPHGAPGQGRLHLPDAGARRQGPHAAHAGRPAGRARHVPGRRLGQAPAAAPLRRRRRGAGAHARGGAGLPLRRANAWGSPAGAALRALPRARRRDRAGPGRDHRAGAGLSRGALAGATCPRASSTPTCSPTTCSSSATSCRA